MNDSPEEIGNRSRARLLLADINAVPATALPRHAAVGEWLRAYLVRSSRAGYTTDESEAADLTAVDHFLRAYEVPVSRESAV